MGYAALTIKTATVASNTSAIMQGIQVDRSGIMGVALENSVIFHAQVDTGAFDRFTYGWKEVRNNGWTIVIAISPNSTDAGAAPANFWQFGGMGVSTDVEIESSFYDRATFPDGYGVKFLKVYLYPDNAASAVDSFHFQALNKVYV